MPSLTSAIRSSMQNTRGTHVLVPTAPRTSVSPIKVMARRVANAPCPRYVLLSRVGTHARAMMVRPTNASQTRATVRRVVLAQCPQSVVRRYALHPNVVNGTAKHGVDVTTVMSIIPPMDAVTTSVVVNMKVSDDMVIV